MRTKKNALHKIIAIYKNLYIISLIRIEFGGQMKRKKILQLLLHAGFTIEEGGSHSRILKDGKFVSVISRQAEVDDRIVKKIEKQTGIKLLAK